MGSEAAKAATAVSATPAQPAQPAQPDAAAAAAKLLRGPQPRPRRARRGGGNEDATDGWVAGGANGPLCSGGADGWANAARDETLAALVASLEAMGFGPNASRRAACTAAAAVAVAASDADGPSWGEAQPLLFERALEWALAHSGDPEFDAPLPPSGRGRVEPPEQHQDADQPCADGKEAAWMAAVTPSASTGDAKGIQRARDSSTKRGASARAEAVVASAFSMLDDEEESDSA